PVVPLRPDVQVAADPPAVMVPHTQCQMAGAGGRPPGAIVLTDRPALVADDAAELTVVAHLPGEAGAQRRPQGGAVLAIERLAAEGRSAVVDDVAVEVARQPRRHQRGPLSLIERDGDARTHRPVHPDDNQLAVAPLGEDAVLVQPQAGDVGAAGGGVL